MTLLPARNVAHVAGALRESPSSRVSMMAAESANIWINRVIYAQSMPIAPRFAVLT